MLYTFWVAYKVWNEKLLPLQGKTRVLALYFLRIIVIFVAFYTPILVLSIVSIYTAPEPGASVTTPYFTWNTDSPDTLSDPERSDLLFFAPEGGYL